MRCRDRCCAPQCRLRRSCGCLQSQDPTPARRGGARWRRCGSIAASSVLVLHYRRMQHLTIEQIGNAIERSKPEEQRQLLARLPRLLGMSAEDIGWLKAAESSFEFWNNDEDAIYDKL